eukprot:5099555-Pyramimonas_sp.AAC.1
MGRSGSSPSSRISSSTRNARGRVTGLVQSALTSVPYSTVFPRTPACFMSSYTCDNVSGRVEFSRGRMA